MGAVQQNECMHVGSFRRTRLDRGHSVMRANVLRPRTFCLNETTSSSCASACVLRIRTYTYVYVHIRTYVLTIIFISTYEHTMVDR